MFCVGRSEPHACRMAAASDAVPPWRCCRCHDLAPTRGLSLDMAAELSPAAANWRAAHVTDAPGNIRFRQCRDCCLARRPCGTATSCRARSQNCTRAGACRRKLAPAGVSEAPALLRTKSGRRSCSSKDRIRALTAVWLTFRRSAARTKLLVATMARKVRASSISIKRSAFGAGFLQLCGNKSRLYAACPGPRSTPKVCGVPTR